MSTRRRWPWIVALLIVAVLAVVAWFAGEFIARSIVEKTIRDQIVTNLQLPADQDIDVDVAGPVLPQLIIGSLADVTIAADDVSFDAISGDVHARLLDVPIRGGDWSSAEATVTLDQPQLQTLLASVDGFPADTITLDPPDVGVAMDLQLFGLTVPVGIDLTPRAENGDLVLTPTTLRVSGAEISAAALAEQFGAIASTVIRDWDVCVAQYFPAAVTLTDVTVQKDAVVAGFEIDSAILRDAAAQENGTCA